MNKCIPGTSYNNEKSGILIFCYESVIESVKSKNRQNAHGSHLGGLSWDQQALSKEGNISYSSKQERPG